MNYKRVEINLKMKDKCKGKKVEKASGVFHNFEQNSRFKIQDSRFIYLPNTLINIMKGKTSN